MVSEKIVVKAKTGLHARPAAQLVALNKSYKSKIVISNSVKEVNGTSMISILSLGLKPGTEIEIRTEGEDEATAMEAVLDFFENLTE